MSSCGPGRRLAPARLPGLLLVAAVVLAGCAAPDGDGPAPATDLDPTEPAPGTRNGGFHVGELRFDAERAWDLAYAQVHHADGSIRYRVPGTPGNAEIREWLIAELMRQGYDAHADPFMARWNCEMREFANVVTSPGHPDRPRILVSAHFDSRPIAEKDPDASRRNEPTPGANDGAAGVAVVLELVRALEGRLNNVTLQVAFWDAEDGGGFGGNDSRGKCTDWILGSTHFATNLTGRDLERTAAMILVDMPGDPELSLKREGFSAMEPHRRLQDWVWRTGRDLGYAGIFRDAIGPTITDDHLPFTTCTLALDVIHLDDDPRNVFARTHHAHSDDMGNVSAASLDVVGRTLEQAIITLDQHAPFVRGEWERPRSPCAFY